MLVRDAVLIPKFSFQHSARRGAAKPEISGIVVEPGQGCPLLVRRRLIEVDGKGPQLISSTMTRNVAQTADTDAKGEPRPRGSRAW